VSTLKTNLTINFSKLGCFRLTENVFEKTHALAYQVSELITAVKGFEGQAPWANVIKPLTAMSYEFS
jgi:hypothetical protein